MPPPEGSGYIAWREGGREGKREGERGGRKLMAICRCVYFHLLSFPPSLPPSLRHLCESFPQPLRLPLAQLGQVPSPLQNQLQLHAPLYLLLPPALALPPALLLALTVFVGKANGLGFPIAGLSAVEEGSEGGREGGRERGISVDTTPFSSSSTRREGGREGGKTHLQLELAVETGDLTPL